MSAVAPNPKITMNRVEVAETIIGTSIFLVCWGGAIADEFDNNCRKHGSRVAIPSGNVTQPGKYTCISPFTLLNFSVTAITSCGQSNCVFYRAVCDSEWYVRSVIREALSAVEKGAWRKLCIWYTRLVWIDRREEGMRNERTGSLLGILYVYEC